MTAVTDWSNICSILKGSNATPAQAGRVADLFAETPLGATNEQRAAAAIAGLRAKIRLMLREKAESGVYSNVLKQAHFPADQPALIASVAAEATAAGAAAETDL